MSDSYKEFFPASEKLRPFIPVAGQMGDGRAASDAYSDLSIDLNKLFRRLLSKSYSNEINLMGLVLRIDGGGWSWGESGVKRLRLPRKSRYVTADICFQQLEYVGVDPLAVRTSLLKRVKEGIDLCSKRLVKDKVDFDITSFEKDLNAAYREIERDWGIEGEIEGAN